MLPKIDVHIHLAGNGCCGSGIWLSKTFQKRYTYRLLKLVQRITPEQEATSVDSDWVERISKLVGESQMDYGVVLGFDGVYDTEHGAWIEKKSQLLIPPAWVFTVCKKYPNLLPGPSINPFRKDALDLLQYCIDEGAVLIKWLPPAQGIDPADPKILDFYRALADAKMPLLVHTGGEKTFATVIEGVESIDKLIPALDLGVTVICAHSATWVLGDKKFDQLPRLKELLGRYPQLWLDNSGICNPSRFFHLPRLAKDPLINERTLYGSDWPVPSNAFYYAGKLGVRKVFQLERMRNVIDRDVATKAAFGYQPSTHTRANQVLANLERWLPKSSSP